MRLVAYMIVAPLECDRYLTVTVEALTGFCDAVRVWADGGAEIVRETLRGLPADVQGSQEPGFFRHEGNARQAAYEWALQANPTHVLAIDADELVSDGAKLRQACAHADVVGLCMQEVWEADEDGMRIRMDGGWSPHVVPAVFPPRRGWRIPPRPAASGRVPREVLTEFRPNWAPTEILHFGWTNPAERIARHARYATQANFGHAREHIASIVYPRSRMEFCSQPWPEGIPEGTAKQMLERTRRSPGMEVPT